VVTDARAPVAVGDRVELSVDPSRLHAFDAETGEALPGAVDLRALAGSGGSVVAPPAV